MYDFEYHKPKSLADAAETLSQHDDFKLLAGGKLDSPPRQRALETAIAWSYDLLSPDQQALFRGFVAMEEA